MKSTFINAEDHGTHLSFRLAAPARGSTSVTLSRALMEQFFGLHEDEQGLVRAYLQHRQEIQSAVLARLQEGPGRKGRAPVALTAADFFVGPHQCLPTVAPSTAHRPDQTPDDATRLASTGKPLPEPGLTGMQYMALASLVRGAEISEYVARNGAVPAADQTEFHLITFRRLARRGFVIELPDGRFEITEAGRVALRTLPRTD